MGLTEKLIEISNEISEERDYIVEPRIIKEVLMLSVNTTITVGTVEKISKDTIDLSLSIPLIALKGDNVGIARNINNHWRLIGFGEII